MSAVEGAAASLVAGIVAGTRAVIVARARAKQTVYRAPADVIACAAAQGVPSFALSI